MIPPLWAFGIFSILSISIASPTTSNSSSGSDAFGDPGNVRHDFLFDNSSGITNEDVDIDEGNTELRRGRVSNEKERLRIALLKQINSLDHLKCFPKVLCGLSVNSTKSPKEIDSYFVRSYIELMRAANPDGPSSEETTQFPKDRDAVTHFLLKSGLAKKKEQAKKVSHYASSSAEDSREGFITPLQKKNEALQSLLQKRKLRLKNDPRDKTVVGESRPRPSAFSRVTNDKMAKHGKGEEEDESITSQIGSLVSSWLSFSFSRDSFEKDPFFKGKIGGNGKETVFSQKMSRRDKEEVDMKKWENDLDQLARLMRLKEEQIKRRKAQSKSKVVVQRSRSNSGDTSMSQDDEEVGNTTMAKAEGRSRASQDASSLEQEILIYSTAVEIGKKLRDPRQCDYLYNGCPVNYFDIIKIIASIRRNLKRNNDDEELMMEGHKTLSSRQKATPYKKKTNKRPSSSSLSEGDKLGDTRRKVTQLNSQAQLKKKPGTHISHILPNGEKVEINVQHSSQGEEEEDTGSKDDGVDEPPLFDEDEYIHQEEQALQEDIDPSTLSAYNQEVLNTRMEMNEPASFSMEDEPAISASYEMEEEMHDDYRRPSAEEIFHKLSTKKKQKAKKRPVTVATTTTTTPPPKKRTKPTKGAVAQERPSSTKRTPTKVTDKPRRPSTVKPRVSGTTNKKKKTQHEHSDTQEKDMSLLDTEESSSTEPSELRQPVPLRKGTKRPTVTKHSPVSASKKTKLPINNASSVSKTQGMRVKSQKKKPSVVAAAASVNHSGGMDVDEDDTSAMKLMAKKKIMIEIDTSSSEEDLGEESNQPNSTTTTSTTTTRPTTVRRRASTTPTSTTTTTTPPTTTTTRPTTTTTSIPSTTTLPALAIFTQSIMDELIADLYGEDATFPSLPAKYSLKTRRKPVYSSVDLSITGNLHRLGSQNKEKDKDPWPPQIDEGIFETKPKPATVSPIPSSEGAPSVKKRIQYKNAKRPYLILMTTNEPPLPPSSGKGQTKTGPNRDGPLIIESHEHYKSPYY